MLTHWKFLLKNHNYFSSVKSAITPSVINISFIISAYCYLVFFLLENLFPGLISRNFDNNLLLLFLFPLAYAKSFFPVSEEQQRSVSKIDYVTVVTITLLIGMFTLNKTAALGSGKYVLALLASSLMIALSGVFLLQDQKELKKWKIAKTTLYEKVKKMYMQIVIAKITVPLPLVFITIIILLLLTSRKIYMFPSYNTSLRGNSINGEMQRPNGVLLHNTHIQLRNGGEEEDTLRAIQSYLHDEGFSMNQIADADKKDYTNVTVKFKSKSQVVVNYLMEKLKNVSENIVRLPLEESNPFDVVIIIGKLHQ